MRNTQYNTFHIKKCCEQKLNISFRSSGEFNGWFVLDNKKIARITVPKGRKFVPPKTYKAMARQLKLSVKQFDDLLDCSLTYNEYVSIIKQYLASFKI